MTEMVYTAETVEVSNMRALSPIPPERQLLNTRWPTTLGAPGTTGGLSGDCGWGSGAGARDLSPRATGQPSFCLFHGLD